MDSDISAVFGKMPEFAANNLLKIRDLILQISDEQPSVGKITECLKWGEPSYVTHSPRTGTTVRLAWKEKDQKYGIYVPCQTTLIEDFKVAHETDLTFDKNRGILFKKGESIPMDLISSFLFHALTYHVKK
ncbi:DUF1801 domain-containing protein [Sneathiella sp. P13V-1]|uniref:DUF1801 domain-containing protein n=1 Tax=Sneathiella sp. P13V-1 TaxID=2697366 RepID=UPI00187B63D3|nr:DUF1801 domain-containing protein [Sneathiella sp. P13V-1]MBE7637834.1 DUF1801 domain-containing protein [Sneathiella sp. P13V-1]